MKKDNYVEDKNWGAKDIPECIKGAMLELQVMHDEIEKNKRKFWKKIVPVHLFENKDEENALNAKFKSEVLPVLLEQQFQSVNYYQDRGVEISGTGVISKYYRCTGRIDNPNLITACRKGIPFEAGQILIRTSGVENSQTGSSSSQVAFTGVLITLQNKFSVEKPVTFAPKVPKTGLVKGMFQKFKDNHHSESDLEYEFNKKFNVITKDTYKSYLTPDLMRELIHIRSNDYFGFTMYFEGDKIHITKSRYYDDKFGFSFYLPDTLEKKFNAINLTIQMIAEIIDLASILTY